jgi:hypothetical protein
MGISSNKISFYSNFNTCKLELSKNEVENMANIDNLENIDNLANIKNCLMEKLNELGIVCSSRNIKLFDLQNNYEIKTTKDLLTKNTQQCKIIIVPVDCNCNCRM